MTDESRTDRLARLFGPAHLAAVGRSIQAKAAAEGKPITIAEAIRRSLARPD